MAANFIGATVTLTSVSDIRYVGRLHSIDHAESTISLEHVNSRGTENRKPQNEFIPPNDHIYDFVVFRAKDVKDLGIEQAPAAPAAVPDDPAIMGTSGQARPAPQSPPGPLRYPQPPQGYPQQPPPGPFGFGGPPPPPGWGPPPGQYPPGAGPYGGYPMPTPPPFHQQAYPHGGPPPQQSPAVVPATPGSAVNGRAPPTGPSSTAPPPASATTPAAAPGSNAPKPSNAPGAPGANAPHPPAPAGPRAPAAPAASAPAPIAGAAVKQLQSQIKPAAGSSSTTNLDKIERALGEMSVSRGQTGSAPAPPPTGAAALPANPNPRVPGSRGGIQPPPGQNRQQQQQPPQAPRGPAPHQQQQQQQQGPRGIVPPQEFDFAESNAKFDKSKVAREAGAILDDSDSDSDSDDDDSHAQQASRRRSSAAQSPKVDKEVYYNKATSFFDSISSDLKPESVSGGRMGGGSGGGGARGGRQWRDEERQRNTCTFGETGANLASNQMRGGYRQSGGGGMQQGGQRSGQRNNGRGDGQGGQGGGYYGGGRQQQQQQQNDYAPR